MKNKKQYPNSWFDLATAPDFLLYSMPFNLLVLNDDSGKKVCHGTLLISSFPDENRLKIQHLGSISLHSQDFGLIESFLQSNPLLSTMEKSFQHSVESDTITFTFTNIDSLGKSLLHLTKPGPEIGRYQLKEIFKLKFFPNQDQYPSSNHSFTIFLEFSPHGQRIQIPFDPHIYNTYGNTEPLIANLDLHLEKYLKENEIGFNINHRCEFSIHTLSEFLNLSDDLRVNKLS